MRKTIMLMFAFAMGVFTTVNSQNIQQSIDQQLEQLLENDQITLQDFNWVVTAQHTSSTSGI